MLSQVTKWGNSQGLRIDKNLLTTLGLEIGDIIEISLGDNELILRPQNIRNIDWLLEDYNRPESLDWEAYDEPKGREEW